MATNLALIYFQKVFQDKFQFLLPQKDDHEDERDEELELKLK
jgi:hypothetical protein